MDDRRHPICGSWDLALPCVQRLYSQRFESQSDIIDLQKRKLELYAGQFNAVELPAPKDKNVILVLPDRWTPYVDQAVQYLEEELREWQRGQQSANRISADIGMVQDAKLLQTYVRLYERLPSPKREELRKEQQEWLDQRHKEAEAAVESHGGSLAPLEFNMKFIEASAARIKELEGRLPAT